VVYLCETALKLKYYYSLLWTIVQKLGDRPFDGPRVQKVGVPVSMVAAHEQTQI